MGALRPHVETLRRAGVGLFVVGNGTPDEARAFAASERLEESAIGIVTDPTLGAYAAAGFGRTLRAALGPRALLGSLAALLRGHAPGRLQGDALQQGGALVVGTDGAIRFRHADARQGDHVRPSDLVEAALRSS